jgi:UDP-N-acetylglucosamine--N-acetylmuramyl-(pentapeptide) pyrophosphoryl-undecaprenol N-acetylglucosamine transferase
MLKKIIFSAGGTGGHIFPAIHLMNHFHDKGYEVLLVTDSRGKIFLKDYSKFKIYKLKTETTTNKNIFKKFVSIFVILYSILISIIIIKKEKPHLVFGFGGYVSFPISFTSKIFNLPLFIYENNLVFGRANKFLSFFAKKIFVAKNIDNRITQKYKNKTYEVGEILDKNLFNIKNFERKNKKDIFTILVLGGSQGAEIFGIIIPNVIKMLKNKGYQIEILQQCLLRQKDSIIKFYKDNNIKNHVFEFQKDIYKLLSLSDLAITRCGASTTAELVITNTPFIGIPLPHSIDNHQYLNAKYYEKSGCCWLLKQSDFTEENLFNLIDEAIRNETELINIQKNMKKKYNNNVYKYIEEEIKEFI